MDLASLTTQSVFSKIIGLVSPWRRTENSHLRDDAMQNHNSRVYRPIDRQVQLHDALTSSVYLRHVEKIRELGHEYYKLQPLDLSLPIKQTTNG